MHPEEVAQEQGEVLDELLVTRIALRIRRFQVHRKRDEVGDCGQNLGKHLDELLVVRVGLARPSRLQTANLGQALERHVPELGHLKEPRPQCLDQGRLKYVAERNPVAEPQQRLQGGLDEAGLTRRVENLLAEVEDLGEFGAHGGFEIARLGRRHLLGRVVKHLFGEETQNGHVVLAHRKAGMASHDDLVNERWPVVRPFLLQNRHEYEI